MSKHTPEPAMPAVSAPTTEWFSYYRQTIEFLRRDVPRLRQIENAALRVASSRRNAVVTDQAALDALDQALEARDRPPGSTYRRSIYRPPVMT